MRSLLVALALLPGLALASDKDKQAKNVDIPPARILVESVLPLLLPYQNEGGLVVVKVAVGEGEQAQAILDTGLPISALSPALAEKQGLKPDGQTEIQTLLGTAKGGQVKAQQVKLGTVTLADVPFVICDMMAHFSADKRADAPPIWLGASAISSLVMTIDPDKQSISFMPEAAPIPDRASVATIEPKNGRWYVDIRINDKKNVRALIDTGAVGMLLPSKLAKDLGLSSPAIVATTLPCGKEGKVALVRLASVAVGNARALSLPAIYVAEGDTAGLEQETPVVGTDFLLRFKVTFHFPKRKIAFEPLANHLDPNSMRLINGPPGLYGNPGGRPTVNPTGQGVTPIRRRPPTGTGPTGGGGTPPGNP